MNKVSGFRLKLSLCSLCKIKIKPSCCDLTSNNKPMKLRIVCLRSVNKKDVQHPMIDIEGEGGGGLRKPAFKDAV